MKTKITIIMLLVINSLSVVAQDVTIEQGVYLKYGIYQPTIEVKNNDTLVFSISEDGYSNNKKELTKKQIKHIEKEIKKSNEKINKQTLKDFEPAYCKFNKAYIHYIKSGNIGFNFNDKEWQEVVVYNITAIKITVDYMYPKIITLKTGNMGLELMNYCLIGLSELMNTGKTPEWIGTNEQQIKKNMSMMFLNVDCFMDWFITNDMTN
jgi:hypothetical protein